MHKHAQHLPLSTHPFAKRTLILQSCWSSGSGLFYQWWLKRPLSLLPAFARLPQHGTSACCKPLKMHFLLFDSLKQNILDALITSAGNFVGKYKLQQL